MMMIMIIMPNDLMMDFPLKAHSRRLCTDSEHHHHGALSGLRDSAPEIAVDNDIDNMHFQFRFNSFADCPSVIE